MQYKSCSKCGGIHPASNPCYIPKAATSEMKLRNTYRWRKKREQVKKDSKYLCAVCKEEGRFTYENIEVHHITKLKDRADLLLDEYNLIPLCVTHHKLADEGKIDADYLRELARRREEE